MLSQTGELSPGLAPVGAAKHRRVFHTREYRVRIGERGLQVLSLPIEAPGPIDFLQHLMEWRGLARKDLGSISGRGLPADVLIRPYPLRSKHAQRAVAAA